MKSDCYLKIAQNLQLLKTLMGLSIDWANPTLGLGTCRQPQPWLLTNWATVVDNYLIPVDRLLNTQSFFGVSTYLLSTALGPVDNFFCYSFLLLLLCTSCMSNSKILCSNQLSLKTPIFIFSPAIYPPWWRFLKYESNTNESPTSAQLLAAPLRIKPHKVHVKQIHRAQPTEIDFEQQI